MKVLYKGNVERNLENLLRKVIKVGGKKKRKKEKKLLPQVIKVGKGLGLGFRV